MNLRRVIGTAIILVWLLTLALTVSPSLAAAGLQLTLNIDPYAAPIAPLVDVAQVLTYRIDFSCSGLKIDCGALTITDTFDINLDSIVVVSVPSGFSSNVTGNLVTITAPNLRDGETGEAVIQVRVKPGATPAATIPNTAQGGVAAVPGTVSSNTITRTVNTTSPVGKWTVTKTKTAPAIDPTIGYPVSFQICLKPTTLLANQTLTNVVLIDTLPTGPNAPNQPPTVLDANGGTVTANTISWNLTNAEVQAAFVSNTCVLRNITVQFETAQGFAIGQNNFTNTASATSTELPVVGPGTTNFNIITGQPTIRTSKTSSGNPVSITNGLGRFFVHADTSLANVPTNKLVLQDDMPLNGSNVPYLLVTRISSGRWSPTTTALVEYSTDAGVNWNSLGTADGTVNIDYTSFSGPVTNVRWTFASGVALGWSMVANPEIDFNPNAPPAAANNLYQNCFTATYDNTVGTPSCASADIETSKVNISPDKTVTGSNFAPEENVPFTLTLNVTERSDPTVPLTNPQIVDTLPAELTFVSSSTPTYDFADCPGSSLSAPAFTNNAGVLTWNWTGQINPPIFGNCSIVVDFTAQVNQSVPASTYHNIASFNTSQPSLHCEADTDNNDSNGCQQDRPFTVRATAVLNSQKWVANPNVFGPPDEASDAFFYNTSNNTDNDPTCPTYSGDNVAPDVTFTRFPCVAKGYPYNATLNNADSNFNYKLVILNTGNVTGTNYYLYDILPHSGDVGSGGPLLNSPRDSEFNPYMTGPVVVGSAPANASGLIFEYNLTYDPDRPEVGVTTGNNTWYTAGTLPGGDWSAVKSFRIRFGGADTLNAGQQMIFMVPMQIDPAAQAGQIAWNSFAHTITSTSTNQALPTAEPRKVGIMVPTRMSIGNRVWLDDGAGGGAANNGIQDGTELGVKDVAVTLYQNNGGVPGAVVATTTTDANGYYLFDQDLSTLGSTHPLDAGDYIVGIDKSNFQTGGPLYDTLNSTNVTTGTDKKDNGVDVPNPTTNGVFSKVITLTLGGAPTGESDLSGDHTAPHDHGPVSLGRFGQTDQNSDLTVDFGFFVPMSLGNRVWLDDGAGSGVRNDGIINGTEHGIDGVQVDLLDVNGNPAQDGFGNPIPSVMTSNGGYYRFDNLPQTTYRVRINANNWTGGTNPLAALVTSTGDNNAAENTPVTADSTDMGIDSASYLTNGIVSGPIILTLGNVSMAETTDLSAADTAARAANPYVGNAHDNLTVDFGFTPTYSVGNRVWKDDGSGGTIPAQINDGLLNGTEAGIAGVTVNLYQASGGNPTTFVATATTDATGYYRFDGLIPSTPTTPNEYVIVVDANSAALSGLLTSTPAFPTLDGNDSRNRRQQVLGGGSVLLGGIASPAFSFPTNTVSTTDADLGSGGTNPPQGHGPNGDDYDNLTIDFGFYPTFSLGNRVWFDSNNNGKLDLGESPIPGVTVNLLTSLGQPVLNGGGSAMQAITDANGYYRFDGLIAGSYVVLIDKSNWTPTGTPGALAGYISSTNNITQGGPGTADSNDNGIDNLNPVLNGIKSTVITLASNNQPQLEDNAGPTSGPAIDTASIVAGAAGDANNNLTVDFGFYRLTVGDTVWLDTGAGANTNNGVQDADESGIVGVIVQLYKGSTKVAQTLTVANGKYLFDQQTTTTGVLTGNPLVPGSDYTIVIPKNQVPLAGMLSSTDLSSTFNPTISGNGVNADDNGKGTSDASTADTVTDTFTLNVAGATNTAGAALAPASAAVTENLTLDFGFHPTTANSYSLGNRVWLDNGAGGSVVTANNGIQDGTEPGIDGVRVLLYAADTGTQQPTTLVQTQTTSGGGYYRFDNITPGSYMVIIDRTNSPVLTGLTVSNNTYTVYTTPNDKHNKGAQTALPLGSPVPNGVPSGIVTIPPAAPILLEPDVDLTNTNPPATHGPNGDAFDELTVDFGFYRSTSTNFSIGNRVWLDNGVGGPLGAANNGIQDGTETGIANVKVNLYLADVSNNPTGAILQTAQTDGLGYYRFDNVAPGDYVVVVDMNPVSSPALNGLSVSAVTSSDFTTPGDQNNKGQQTPLDALSVLSGGIRSAVLTVPPVSAIVSEPDVTGIGAGAHGSAGDANDVLTADFGFYQNPTTGYSVGNRVWLDDGNGGGNANDGIQDANEAGLPLVPVKLFAANPSGTPLGAPLQTVNTDASGYYRFDAVNPGNYVVVIDLPTFNSSSATKYKLTGASFTAYDTPADQQNKGKQTLLGVGSSLPGGIVSSLLVVPQAAPVQTEPDTTASGMGAHGPSGDDMDVLTADFGLVTIPANSFSIGNRVWLDNGGGVPLNFNNGKQDSGEAGIPAVTVSLYADDGSGNPTGPALQTTTTDSNGYYRFDGVPLTPTGKYVVGVDTSSPNLTNLLPSTPVSTDYATTGDKFNKGTLINVPFVGVVSTTVDVSKASGTTGEPDVVNGGAGDHGPLGDATDILTADFGFYANPQTSYSIGNRVWFDNGIGVGGVPNDGIQNGTEPGIPNVKLALFFADSSGAPIGNTPIATTVTSAPNGAIPGDTGGYYRFDNLTPGDYVVIVDSAGSSALYGFTPSTPSFTDYTTPGDQNNKGQHPPLTQGTPIPGGIASSRVTITKATQVKAEPDEVNGGGAADHGPNGDNLDVLTVDFGFVAAPKTFSIGNRVWSDTDKDGKQGPNESGIGGVKVLLYQADSGGQPTTLIGSTTTDDKGFYRFDGLTPGDYVVVVDVANSSPLSGSTLTQTLVTTPNTNITDAQNNGLPGPVPGVPNGVMSGLISLGARPVEPIGELVPLNDAPGSVFSLNNEPQASDDHGNLTVDFGFVTPKRGGGTGNANGADPAIVKLVDPGLALPGEKVTFTIIVTNKGTDPAEDVVITDPVPTILTVKGANTSQGTFTINGNLVTFTIGTVNPGQTVKMTIVTQARTDIDTPVDGINEATLNWLGGSSRVAAATFRIIRRELPATGEHPDAPVPSDPLGGLLIGIVLCAGLVIVRWNRQRGVTVK